jgi:hypothetical protein
VTSRHQRFALRDVTFEGLSIPGATVDRWLDGRGGAQWSARVVARPGPIVDEGELSGRMPDGTLFSGHALVADRQMGPGGKREMLIVFHGSGDFAAVVEQVG